MFYSETPIERVHELETQVEAAQDEMLKLDNQIELVQGSRERFDALAGHSEIYAMALAAGEISVEAQFSLFDGLRIRAEELDEECGELLARKRALGRLMEQLEKQLEQVRSSL